MSIKAPERVRKDTFDYAAFERDLRAACAEKGSSPTELSIHKFFHSKNFINEALKNGTLLKSVAVSLTEYIGTDISKYEIKPKEPEPEPEVPAVSEPEKQSEETPFTGWSCQIRADEEFGTVMMKILKDGQDVVIGRSYMLGRDETGIVQSISYAAHMCYKFVQQNKIRAINEKAAEIKPPIVATPQTAEKPPFGEWMQKFSGDNTTSGALARFIRDNPDFPMDEERAMRNFLKFHGGSAHLSAFSSAYGMYLAWCRAGKNA